MLHKELSERIISMDSMVNSKKFKSLDFTSEDLKRVGVSAEKCSKLPLIIDDYSGSTLFRIRNQCLRHKAKYGKLRMIVIDYLQLIPYEEVRKGNKADDIGILTRGLKLLSKEIGCPIICLSQLNRGVETRENKRPNLADLRDSGAIEQDADMVWFIYRDEVYNPETKHPSEAEIIISKNRGGETGTAKLSWRGEFTKFSDRAEDVF
jgi:replicative DNA helicase